MTSLHEIRRSGVCFRFLPCQHHSIILWSHPIPTEEPIQNCQLWELRTWTRTITFLLTLTLPKPSRHITEFNIYVSWLKAEVCRNSDYKTVPLSILKSIFHVPCSHVQAMGKRTGCMVQVHCSWRRRVWYVQKVIVCGNINTFPPYMTKDTLSTHTWLYSILLPVQTEKIWVLQVFLTVSLAGFIVSPFSAIAKAEKR